MSGEEDSQKDDVLVSLRRIMRGGRPGPEDAPAKGEGGRGGTPLFGRRRAGESAAGSNAETSKDAGANAAPEAPSSPEGSDAEAAAVEPDAAVAAATADDRLAEETADGGATDAPETPASTAEMVAEAPAIGDEPAAPQGGLLSLGDFMMETSDADEAAEAEPGAAMAAEDGDAPQLAEEREALEAEAVGDNLGLPESADATGAAEDVAADDDLRLEEEQDISLDAPDAAPSEGLEDGFEEPEPDATLPDPVDVAAEAPSEAPTLEDELPPLSGEVAAEIADASGEVIAPDDVTPAFPDEPPLPEEASWDASEPDPAVFDPTDTAFEPVAEPEPGPEAEDEPALETATDADPGPVVDTPEPDAEPAAALDPGAAAAAALVPAAAAPDSAPAPLEEGKGGAVIMDESALEDMIRRVIRAELVEGDLGRNISANVKRLIEDEIARAMLNRSKD